MSFTGPYGVYHSVYDNHLWMQKFGDPGFVRHAAMTRLWGVWRSGSPTPTSCRSTTARRRLACASSSRREPRRHAPGDRAALRPLDGRRRSLRRRGGQRPAARIETLLAAETADSRRGRARQTLMKTERAFLDAAGIPGRPWYRHLITRRSRPTRRKCSPASSEALDAGDRKQVAVQVAQLVTALDRAAAVLHGEGRGTR